MFVVVRNPLRVARLFMMDRDMRQFRFGVRVAVLCPTPGIALVFLFRLEVVYGGSFPVVVRVLVELFADFVLIFIVAIFVIYRQFVDVTCTVLFVRLHFRGFGFVRFDAFTITGLSPYLNALVVPYRRI